MKKIWVWIWVFSLWAFGAEPPESADVEQRIADLLASMTLEEKLGQLTQYSGSNREYKDLVKAGKIGSFLNVTGAQEVNVLQRLAREESRLGIPLLFGLDVIHGYKTIFPIPLAAAASWDTALVRKAAAIAAREALAEGIGWTFAPMVDIARDARWGRIAEGAGEDPFLGQAMTRVQVLGFQGDQLGGPHSLLACAKHYVAYGAAEGGRDYNTVDISERTLREIYLPPFQAAVNAGVGTLMSAFNEIGGVPASANYHTLTEILRQEWGFDGFVVSDWNSIGELINHGIAADRAEAGHKALLAGVDMDMEGHCFSELKRKVQAGEVSEHYIDQAVARILSIKFRCGLFDQPYTDPALAKKVIGAPDHIKTARQLARESIVLLQNGKQLLPLDKELNHIVMIGPLAKDTDAPLGTWRCLGNSQNVTSLFDGLKQKVSPQTKVSYVQGCAIRGDKVEFRKAVKLARQADVVILALGEPADMSGEAASRACLELPGRQAELVDVIHKTGTPTVAVLMSGRPLALNRIPDKLDALLMAWHLGDESGHAIADVLVGDFNPCGKLPVTFPRVTGQVPLYYNHKNTGRPYNPDEKFTSKYLSVPPTPLFPFGYGLSYTEFRYYDLKVKPQQITPDSYCTIQVTVKNKGQRAGTEVVQLYVYDRKASVTPPVKKLQGFRRIFLEPGESEVVVFKLKSAQLALYDLNMQRTVEPGQFDILVGGNSEDLLSANLEVIE